MYLLVCGEGCTDIGSLDYTTGVFTPSAMYHMIDKLIELKIHYSLHTCTPENIQYISKSKLVEISKRLRVLPKKETPQGTLFFYKQARALAMLAEEKQEEVGYNAPVIAVLFHDTDGTNTASSTLYQEKYQSILYGLKSDKFSKGVAMLPKPKSEAWLLYCMDRFFSPVVFKQVSNYEDLPGNDSSPNSAKKEYASKLERFACTHEDICERIDDTFDLMKIDLPSFVDFRTRLFEVLR